MSVEVTGRRMGLREFREEDLAAVEAWYGEAAKAAGIPHPRPPSARLRTGLSRRAGEGRSVIAETGGTLVIAQVGERQPIGLVDYRRDDPEMGWLTVRFIALAKTYRGWGYGSEAVRLLEEWAAREGPAQRFRAEVDARNGLGLYFWLRLGYRPGPVLSRESGDGDIIAMIREA